MVELFDEMLQWNLDGTQRKDFEQWLGNYISKVNGYSGVLTLLHAACDRQIQFIPLLLVSGADPVWTDEKGWALFHFSLNRLAWHKDGVSASVQFILNAGAHMDQLNSRGQAPLCFFLIPWAVPWSRTRCHCRQNPPIPSPVFLCSSYLQKQNPFFSALSLLHCKISLVNMTQKFKFANLFLLLIDVTSTNHTL